MMEFKAAAFYEATSEIRRIVTVIHARDITSTRETPDGGIVVEAITDPVFLAMLRDNCTKLMTSCDVLGAKITKIAVEELHQLLGSTGFAFPTYDNVKIGIREIETTLRRELTVVTLLSLDSKEKNLYSPNKPLFGAEFSAKFQGIAEYEIDEAAKCLALSRSTACVFHLMRVMEIGIRAVARCLGISDPIRAGDRNWGNILRDIKIDLAAHGGSSPAKIWTVAGDKEFFERAYASLDAVRVAWRNTTMHVENKYTGDEAEHVLGAVRGFMSQLASRCDQNGDPRA